MSRTVADQIQKAVRATSLQQVARELGSNRNTLAAYLAESARPGSALLIENRWKERQKQTGGSARA
jgi:hypothetical protein